MRVFNKVVWAALILLILSNCSLIIHTSYTLNKMHWEALADALLGLVLVSCISDDRGDSER